MSPISSNIGAYEFALGTIKQSAEKEGQVLKAVAEDKTAPPTKGVAPVRAAPVSGTSALGQKVDITV